MQVLMIEGFCEFLTEDEMLQAVAAGAAAIEEVGGSGTLTYLHGSWD